MNSSQSVTEPPAATLAPRTRRPGRVARGHLPPWWVLLPATVLTVGVHFIAPLTGAFFAFTDWGGLGSFQFVGLQNFQRILDDPVVGQALLRTIVLAAAFVVITTLIGVLLALALNRTMKSGQFLRSLFFLPFVISPLATAYVWQYVLGYTGPLNQILQGVGLKSAVQVWLGNPVLAPLSVLLVVVWQYIGLAMILYLAGLQNVPEEVLEASLLDGAGPWLRFRHIMLPHLAPSITVATALLTIFGLRFFDQIIALTGGGPVDATQTLATQVYQQVWVNGDFGYGTSISVLLTVLVIVVTLGQVVILRRRERNV